MQGRFLCLEFRHKPGCSVECLLIGHTRPDGFEALNPSVDLNALLAHANPAFAREGLPYCL